GPASSRTSPERTAGGMAARPRNTASASRNVRSASLAGWPMSPAALLRPPRLPLFDGRRPAGGVGLAVRPQVSAVVPPHQRLMGRVAHRAVVVLEQVDYRPAERGELGADHPRRRRANLGLLVGQPRLDGGS